MDVNVHHLELFYYVARYKGITSAVRKMPYGIQQPAVSGQLLQLERNLGVKLFHRRPFALTAAGEELYEFARPFFSKLPEIAAKLSGEDQRHLRLAASAIVVANHIPAVVEGLRKEIPDLRLSLRDFLPGGVEEAILNDEVDLAVSVPPEKLAAGLSMEPLLELPLVLVSVAKQGVSSFAQLAKLADEDHRLRFPLITLPAHEVLVRLFQDALDERGLRWDATIEVNALELVQVYAAEGYGYGLMVEAPGVTLPEGLVKIPLPDFPKLELCILHRGELKPLAARFLELARKYLREIAPRKK